MKKTLAKWLVKISEYILTALVLTSLYAGTADLIAVLAGVAVALACLTAGLILIAEDETPKTPRKGAKKGSAKGKKNTQKR